ncbi:hypothetical protein [Glaciecola sp. 1036]|uniref:hypothetical protein n=1 Tax=Alteromonadaceae TaxID=72275 RepID=UPI003D03BA87
MKRSVLLVIGVALLSGCMSKEAVNNDHQMRMQRCEQYIGDAREKCLQGENVTIEDYKEDLKEFKKQEHSEEEQVNPVTKPID